jgi:uncharacterized protein (DUF924 family)
MTDDDSRRGPWTRGRAEAVRARAALPESLRAVLAFWFGAPDAPDFGLPREAWWQKDAIFDGVIRDRFAATHADVLAGCHDDLLANADAALAMIVTLDQFSRNMYRGGSAMYAADERARLMARRTIERGHDARLLAVERWFVYLPFEHSEQVSDQGESARLFRTLAWHEPSKLSIESADLHREIVVRFGRFPHRNAILGRATTEDEARFLLEPKSSF